MNALSTLFRSKDWEAPTFTMPAIFDARSLEPLGEIHGTRWWKHPKHADWGELQEDRKPLREDFDIVPDRPIAEIEPIDGARQWRAFTPHAPGSFARLSSGWTTDRRPKRAPADRVVDGLDAIPLLDGRPAFAHVPATDKVRGASSIVHRLATRGVGLRPSVDGSRLVVSTPGGRLGGYAGLLELVERATPLLLPYLLHGKAPSCQVGRHAKPVEAVTVALGGAVACGECVR